MLLKQIKKVFVFVSALKKVGKFFVFVLFYKMGALWKT